MKINGYMVEVEWDGHALRARGTNKASHRALMGYNEDVKVEDYVKEDQSRGKMLKEATKAMGDFREIPDALVLNRDEFTVEKFKTANPLINGNLVLRTNSGRKHQLHFRRKHNDDFTALAKALGAD